MGSLAEVSEEDAKVIESMLGGMDPLIQKVEGMVSATQTLARSAIVESAMAPIKPFAEMERVAPSQSLGG